MTNQLEKDVKDGYISLCIPNKITRRAIEAFLASGMGVPDTSFNKNILKIRLIDIMMASIGDDESENFVSDIMEKIKEQDSAFKLTKSMKKLDKKNIGEYMEKIIDATMINNASAGIVLLLNGLLATLRG